MANARVHQKMVLDDKDNLGSNQWSRQYPDILILTTRSQTKKLEYFDQIGWEQILFKTPTKLQELHYENCCIKMMLKSPLRPLHKTLKRLFFQNCDFAPECYLSELYQIETIHFTKCTGSVELRQLKIKSLHCNDCGQQCFTLNKSTVYHIFNNMNPLCTLQHTIKTRTTSATSNSQTYTTASQKRLLQKQKQEETTRHQYLEKQLGTRLLETQANMLEELYLVDKNLTKSQQQLSNLSQQQINHEQH